MKTWEILKHIEEGGRVRVINGHYASAGKRLPPGALDQENLKDNLPFILSTPERFEIVKEKKKYAYLREGVYNDIIIYKDAPDAEKEYSIRLPDHDITIND